MRHRTPTPGRRRAQEPVIAASPDTFAFPFAFDPKLAGALLDWYAARRRDLPWRRSGDPYAVWVSEIMLQQTRVATVIPYFERWLARFPDIRSLAAASEDDVLHCWQGLGYYSRARRLLQGAREVVARFGGEIPSTATELRSLPGVGPYTAGAIASIAFGRDEPAVDGNVVRVLCRLFALRGDPAKAPLRNELAAAARTLLPPGRAADFNQALMELGAVCCTPSSPHCGECPVRAHCAASNEGATDRYPELARRKKATQVTHVAALVRRGGKILVVRVPEHASRWAGLWRLPSTVLGKEENEAEAAIRAVAEVTGSRGQDAGPVTDLIHHVTRYRVHLKLRAVKLGNGRIDGGEIRWRHPTDTADLAMPAPDRKLVVFLSTLDAK